MLLRSASVALALVLGLATAGAETAVQEAKRHYAAGTRQFDLQNYAVALEEFKQAYALKEDASFLFNIAQCQRLLGQREAAIRSYRTFLTRAPAAPNRRDVESRIDVLQREVDEQKRAEAAPPVVVAPVAAPVPAPVVTTEATLVAPAPARKPTPVYKKWWLWTAVGVVAVGVGLGVGLGLGLHDGHREAVGSPVTFR